VEEIYRLTMLSPLHIGERGTGMEASGETIASDTLFSALCWGLREVEGDGWLREWIDAFRSRPAPLRISSTFPYLGGVRFYPKPALRLPDFLAALTWKEADESVGKRLKRVTHVSEGLFRRWLGSRLSDIPAGSRLLPGGLWVGDDETSGLPSEMQGRWAERSQTARVALDRVSSSSSLYQVGDVRYRPGCGLWFAVRWREEGWREPLEAALSCLGEAGMGGERSSGRGQFRWEREAVAGLGPPPVGSTSAVTLSLYHPTSGEVDAGALDNAAYQLKLRRGWIGSAAGQGLRGKSVRMLAEGSAIAADPEAGDLVDVTPEGFSAHPVYRYGLAFQVATGVESDG
jgi:CRISPR-associated protein Csm4